MASAESKIETASELRRHFGEPKDLSVRKTLPKLDMHCRNFIAASPFLVLSSSGKDGNCDASPRGDAPGFVAVLDDTTLLIPERPGNKRVDSLSNILENPRVGLLFFVPGMNETLRVNGRAAVTRDANLLAPLAVNGKPPVAGIVVTVEAAFLHCAKALIRSRLWDPASRIDRKSFPSLGQMLADQIGSLDGDETQDWIEEGYRKRLY